MLRAHTAPVSLGSAVLRRTRRSPAVSAIGPSSSSYTSSGLSLSGSVMNTTAFTVREDVKVTRSEDQGNTTVTIKVRSAAACRPCGVRTVRADVRATCVRRARRPRPV